jgi:hypothetical protein
VFQGNPFSDGELLIALPRLVGIVFSEGGRCAGDDERARCEGARAIDRSLLNEGCFSLAFAWDAAAALKTCCICAALFLAFLISLKLGTALGIEPSPGKMYLL